MGVRRYQQSEHRHHNHSVTQKCQQQKTKLVSDANISISTCMLKCCMIMNHAKPSQNMMCLQHRMMEFALLSSNVIIYHVGGGSSKAKWRIPHSTFYTSSTHTSVAIADRTASLGRGSASLPTIRALTPQSQCNTKVSKQKHRHLNQGVRHRGTPQLP